MSVLVGIETVKKMYDQICTNSYKMQLHQVKNVFGRLAEQFSRSMSNQTTATSRKAEKVRQHTKLLLTLTLNKEIQKERTSI